MYIKRDEGRNPLALVMGQVSMEGWEKMPCCRQSQGRVTCNLELKTAETDLYYRVIILSHNILKKSSSVL